jgi:serine/threonine protein kinase
MVSANKSLIGRYEVLEEIGRGAMGIVYRARDPHIDRIVAIKTISLLDLEPSEEREYRNRFQQEARTAGRLLHPGIVAVFDVGPESNDPYIVMEYVAGRPLSKLLTDANGRLPLATALQMVGEVAEALDYAHREKVIHRDVKPANILLTPDGRAKLADFGIARMDQSHLTLPGRLMGSPAYMAPEQMKGEAVDARSDLFSLGVVLYRVTTGYRPFQGNSTATVCYKLLRQDALPPSALNAELPFALDDFLAKAMAKDPAERFQTGAEMALAIRALGLSIVAQPDPLEPMRRLIDRTGVYHIPAIPLEQPVLEVPVPSVEVVVALTRRSHPGEAKHRTNPALAIVLAVAIVLAALLWGAHHSKPSAAQEMQPDTTQEKPQKSRQAQPLKQTSDLAQGAQSLAPTRSGQSAPKPVPTKLRQSERTATARAQTKNTQIASESESMADGPHGTSGQPIIVHSMNIANLDVVIEHGFEDATASVSVDQKPTYSQQLHGESKRHALLFRRTQGKQSGTIALLPGKHNILVRVQSADGRYDISKTFSEGFSQGSTRILRIKCDKGKNKLDAVIR